MDGVYLFDKAEPLPRGKRSDARLDCAFDLKLGLDLLSSQKKKVH